MRPERRKRFRPKPRETRSITTVTDQIPKKKTKLSSPYPHQVGTWRTRGMTAHTTIIVDIIETILPGVPYH